MLVVLLKSALKFTPSRFEFWHNISYLIDLTDLNCISSCTFSYLEFLQALEEKVDQDWSSISLSLEEIRRSLLSRDRCLINLTADGKNLKNVEKFVGKFLDMLPSNSPVETVRWKAQLPPTHEAIVIPTQVQILFPLLLKNYKNKHAHFSEDPYHFFLR